MSNFFLNDVLKYKTNLYEFQEGRISSRAAEIKRVYLKIFWSPQTLFPFREHLHALEANSRSTNEKEKERE